MKQNHFYIAYFGNKRNEVLEIEKHINMDNITHVIEPYCGSCAISYYLWTKYPNITYVLNDNNKYLKEMYEIIINDDKRLDFENKINDIVPQLLNDKTQYLLKIKEQTIYGWFIKNKIYNIRPGTYPNDLRGFKNKIDLTKCNIYNFFKNGNIIFTCEDGIICYNNYKDNNNNLIFLDPPYIQTEISYYKESNTNIYEYLYENNIMDNKTQICLILQDIFIIRLLFKDQIKHSYSKKYMNHEKRRTTHIIITNK